MAILFSAVANKANILAKHALCEGNFMEIVEEVLSKIPLKDHKMTYSHGHCLFHYIIEREYFYFCITAKINQLVTKLQNKIENKRPQSYNALLLWVFQNCQRSRSFLFLNEIRRRFKSTRKNGLSNILEEEMLRYNADYSTIGIRKGDLDELNNIAVGSSESILGGKVLYVNNPENLTFSTISYVDKSPQQTDATINSCKNFSSSKFYFIIAAVILILIWLVITNLGAKSLVVITCIFIFSIVRLNRVENKALP